MKSLKEVISSYVKLHAPNNKGWHPCVHKGCDHGKKGPRAAFKFHSDDGVEFNCFNCSIHTGFSPTENNTFSNKFKKILLDFNIPEDEWKSIELKAFIKLKEAKEKEARKVKHIEPKELLLPSSFISLKDIPLKNKWAQVAYAYLESRKIDADAYTFFLSMKKTDKWFKRLIIPFYKDKKLIYYTGRDLTGKARKKYENPLVERDNVIFNFDLLLDYEETPLYIVEGVIDALSIPNCIAIIGNKLTEGQIEWINRSNRQKIFIPDKVKGLQSAYSAIDLGWSISTPEIADCNDINDAVVEFGRLYVIKSIRDNIRDGEMAKIAAGLYCES